MHDPDTLEKANIGACLAEISNEKVVFWMAERANAPDFRARLNAVIGVGV